MEAQAAEILLVKSPFVKATKSGHALAFRHISFCPIQILHAYRLDKVNTRHRVHENLKHVHFYKEPLGKEILPSRIISMTQLL